MLLPRINLFVIRMEALQLALMIFWLEVLWIVIILILTLPGQDITTIVTGPTQSVRCVDITNLPTIGADSYFVKVKKRSGFNPGSGCESLPFKVEILDKSKNPDIAFTSDCSKFKLHALKS